MYSNQSLLTEELTATSVHGQAAVLIAIAGPSFAKKVLLTQRSYLMNSHSGEVALPGGMWEPQDENLQATAIREAQEEVGLCPTLVSNVQPMAARATRRGIRVTPFVADVPEGVSLQSCPRELDSLFWLPIQNVLNDDRVHTDIFVVDGKEYWAPVYQFEGYKIWGFTARLLVDFANHFYGANIVRANSAAEVVFSCF